MLKLLIARRWQSALLYKIKTFIARPQNDIVKYDGKGLVAELADATDLKSVGLKGRAGSNPALPNFPGNSPDK